MTNYRLTPLRDIAKNKERIIEKTRHHMKQPTKEKSKKKRAIVPVLAAVCVLILILFLAGPYVYQAFFLQQKFSIEKVIFPESAHNSLYKAIYIDATNEFVYSKEDGFYSFDVATEQEILILATTNIGYGYVASEKWIVWNQHQDNQSVLNILNRQTNALRTIIDQDSFISFKLQGDSIISLAMVKNEEQQLVWGYTIFNLVTEQMNILVEHTMGSRSMPAIDGEKAVISQELDMDTGKQTIISVHDIRGLDDLETYIVPYEIVERLTIKGNKIYGYMWNSNDDEPANIGMIDIETGAFTILQTSVSIHDYATDGQYFAIAVQKGDSNSVQLFEEQDGQLKRISSLPNINERLVLPRFTEDGTLVVTSEGPERPIYLIRF